MATYNDSNSSGNDWGSWIPIIVLFCIPTPVTWIIAFVWLVNKLRGTVRRGNFRGNVKRHPYDIQHDQAAPGADWEQVSWDGAGQDRAAAGTQAGTGRQAEAQSRAQGEYHYRYRTGKTVTVNNKAGKTVTVNNSARTSGAASTPGRSGRKDKKAKKPGKAPGFGLIIGGACTAGTFLVALVTMIGEAMQYGWADLEAILPCLVFFAGGLSMLFTGLGMNRRTERYASYLGYIGANREVDLARMAASFDVPVKKLCRDLRQMLAKGILPNGYLDLAEGKLFLTEMGYRPPQQAQKAQPEPEQARQSAAQSAEKEDAILREIRQVNDDIPDEAMSAKIDRIEEITRKILAYQKQHPDREGQLRTFLNYYLPTTLKILRAYAQLEAQGIEGQNISAAKSRIEGMMDQVVAGFEKQLDRLFQDDAMDIASDVQVLENMLKKDGLSGGEGTILGI